MKKSLILSSIIGVGVILASGFTAVTGTGIAYYTNSPADGQTCSQCHSGGSTTPVGKIIASPAFGGSGNNLTYVPGTTYTLTVTQTGYTEYGFDIEIMNSNSASGTGDAGTMTALNTTYCKNNGTGPTNVTHKTPIPTATGATIKWVAPASGTAYLYAAILGVNGNGSTSGDKVMNIAYVITPAATTPAPVAAFSSSSTSACAGSSITLTDNSTNTPTSWAWTLTGASPATSTAQNPTVSYATPGTYTVTLVATNSGGSSTPISKTITVNAIPSVAATSTSVCYGSQTSITASGAATYVWSTGGNSATIIVSPTSNTSYTVTGTSNGCSKTAVSNVTVNSLPVVTAASQTICTTQTTATLSASGASTYIWSTGSTAATCVVNPTTTTTYTVTGTDANGCKGTATPVITVHACSMGINTYETGQVSIYPNPANEFLNIDLGTITGEKVAELMDVSGRVIMKKITEGNNMQLNLADVSKGSYFIKITNDKNVIAAKMIMVAR